MSFCPACGSGKDPVYRTKNETSTWGQALLTNCEQKEYLSVIFIDHKRTGRFECKREETVTARTVSSFFFGSSTAGLNEICHTGNNKENV